MALHLVFAVVCAVHTATQSNTQSFDSCMLCAHLGLSCWLRSLSAPGSMSVPACICLRRPVTAGAFSVYHPACSAACSSAMHAALSCAMPPVVFGCWRRSAAAGAVHNHTACSAGMHMDVWSCMLLCVVLSHATLLPAVLRQAGLCWLCCVGVLLAVSHSSAAQRVPAQHHSTTLSS